MSAQVHFKLFWVNARWKIKMDQFNLIESIYKCCYSILKRS